MSNIVERLIADVGPTFMRLGKARGGRAFHKLATTLAGQLQVVANPALPAHAFFVPGRKLPVLVRAFDIAGFVPLVTAMVVELR